MPREIIEVPKDTYFKASGIELFDDIKKWFKSLFKNRNNNVAFNDKH